MNPNEDRKIREKFTQKPGTKSKPTIRGEFLKSCLNLWKATKG
jgi:hypothetical protein